MISGQIQGHTRFKNSPEDNALSLIQESEMALANLKQRQRNNTIDHDAYTYENTVGSRPNQLSLEKFNSMTNSISNESLFDMDIIKKIAQQKRIKQKLHVERMQIKNFRVRSNKRNEDDGLEGHSTNSMKMMKSGHF